MKHFDVLIMNMGKAQLSPINIRVNLHTFIGNTYMPSRLSALLYRNHYQCLELRHKTHCLRVYPKQKLQHAFVLMLMQTPILNHGTSLSHSNGNHSHSSRNGSHHSRNGSHALIQQQNKHGQRIGEDWVQ